MIDARGRGGSPFGGGGRAVRVGKLGCGPLLLLLVLALVFGVNPLDLLGGGGAAPAPAPTTQQSAPGDDVSQFMSAVLGSTEDAWNTVFQRAGAQYREPQLVLFSGTIQSACGFNTAATGPFYCPADQRLYLDTGFFGQLQRMGAPGDFAMAYVIGHEVGHHVQNLQGTLGQVQRQQQRVGGAEANRLSVATELQADCYAGVWARFAQGQNLLEPGDLEEGLRAAAAVGDDRIQGGAARPETFTHGTSQQRAQWFQRGYQSGDPGSCDTF